jgi:hypothetical protein
VGRPDGTVLAHRPGASRPCPSPGLQLRRQPPRRQQPGPHGESLDARAEAVLLTLKGHTNSARSVSLTPDGKRLPEAGGRPGASPSRLLRSPAFTDPWGRAAATRFGITLPPRRQVLWRTAARGAVVLAAGRRPGGPASPRNGRRGRLARGGALPHRPPRRGGHALGRRPAPASGGGSVRVGDLTTRRTPRRQETFPESVGLPAPAPPSWTHPRQPALRTHGSRQEVDGSIDGPGIFSETIGARRAFPLGGPANPTGGPGGP